MAPWHAGFYQLLRVVFVLWLTGCSLPAPVVADLVSEYQQYQDAVADEHLEDGGKPASSPLLLCCRCMCNQLLHLSVCRLPAGAFLWGCPTVRLCLPSGAEDDY